MSHTAFLSALQANPDDDGPRLIYADWLEEQGDPRGEFIRLQCELARCPHDECRARDPAGKPVLVETTCDRCGLGSPLRRREGELLEAHWEQWFTTPPFPRDTLLSNATFRRGFVEKITLSAACWLAHADTLVAATPLREVVLTTRPADGWLIDHVPDWPIGTLYSDVIESALSRQWPRLLFIVPPAGPSVQAVYYDEVQPTPH